MHTYLFQSGIILGLSVKSVEPCRTAFLWVTWLIQLHHKLTSATAHTEPMLCSTYTYGFLTEDCGLMLEVLLSFNYLAETDLAERLPWLTFVYLFIYLISVKIVSHSWRSHFSENEVVGKDTCHYWCWNTSAIFMLRSFRSTYKFYSDYFTMNVHKELFYYCDFIICLILQLYHYNVSVHFILHATTTITSAFKPYILTKQKKC